MTTDQARSFLTSISKPEYHKYIRNELAGDFAVMISIKIKTKMKESRKLNNELNLIMEEQEIDITTDDWI